MSIMEENENDTGNCEEMQEEVAALVCTCNYAFSGNHNQAQQSTHAADVTTEETIGLDYFHRCRTKLECITNTTGDKGIW